MDGGDRRLCNVLDYENYAKEKLNDFAWVYYSSGVNRQQTIHDSRLAFQRYRFRPRVLRDVSTINLTTSVLGEPIAIPFCIGPTAAHAFANYGKEIATGKAADETNTLMVLSSSSMTRIEELRNQVPKGLFWMQTYLFKDKRVTLSNIRRAEAANFKALVVTIDSSGLGQNPIYSEYRWELEKLRESPNLRLVNYDNDFLVASPEDKLLTGYAAEQINGSSSSLDDVKWLRSVTKLPIILKGILNSSVAKKAAESGLADGILVSAHGGRQLDSVPAPIEVLQEIVEAVRGTGVEVYMDGGIRTGTDILKALSLGARAVFLGRPVIWGLSVNESHLCKTAILHFSSTKEATFHQTCKEKQQQQQHHQQQQYNQLTATE
ncbi:putative hydroxyacid oxidase 1 [Apostichopus japonicus]|uniref:(S)-2-hydroxy-acid oxidase n=1 Tax=Stichopus japonicus TaxID=307972 RepID=A0A2G8JSP5_STIJA|nr:putative hydroxyacid oxidase 1 [Apostichopus japonicus]